MSAPDQIPDWEQVAAEARELEKATRVYRPSRLLRTLEKLAWTLGLIGALNYFVGRGH